MLYSTIIPFGYGVVVAAALLIGWLSRDHVHQKLGLILMFAWAATNVITAIVGFDGAWLVIPSLDGAMALLTAILGYANRSRIALIVFALYAAVGAIHVGAIILHAQLSNSYYTVTGVLFLSQLLAVGWSGARMALRARLAPRHQRLRHHLARR